MSYQGYRQRFYPDGYDISSEYRLHKQRLTAENEQEVDGAVISEIAFHAATPNFIVNNVPCDAELGTPLRKKWPPDVSALSTDQPMDWETWSILIDMKLFGHETAFSRIPQPVDL